MKQSIFNSGKKTSPDLEKRVTYLLKRGHSRYTVAKRLLLDRRTVKRISYSNGLKLKSKTRPLSVSSKVNEDVRLFIYMMIVLDPCLYLWELCRLVRILLGIRISISYMCRIRKMYFARRRISQISSYRNTLRVKEVRMKFCDNIRSFYPEQLIFIDETHLDWSNLNRRYGWFTAQDDRIVPQQSSNRQSYSFIVAMSYHSVLTTLFKETHYEGVKENDFLVFLRRLRPYIKHYHVLIFDNARIHRTEAVMRWMQDERVNYMLLSPYSPDYNPIELLFNTLKSWLRSCPNRDGRMKEVVDVCMTYFTSKHLKHFVNYCRNKWESNIIK